MAWLTMLLLVADIVLVGLVASGSLALPAVAVLLLHIALLTAAFAGGRRRPAPAPEAEAPTAAPVATPATPPVTAATSPPRPARASSTRHILLVEDEADLRTLVQRILQEEGYEVSCAAHAAEAREALEDGALPDALVTDLSMPGDDGVLLAGEFRRRWPQLPVLFTSGYPDRLERIDRQEMDRVATLAKPFPPDLLVSRLDELIGGDRQQDRGQARG